MTTTRRLTDEELAALGEQRDFLLRSLEDLEAERAAGDVDDQDYEVLRDDYTRRAAQAMRAIEAHRARSSRRRRVSWRPAAVVAGVVLFALGAGVLVAQTAGRRQAGDTVTGGAPSDARAELIRASDLARQGRYEEALDSYDGVLEDDPDNVEALTYKGWIQVQMGDPDGVRNLGEVTQQDPDYPDAHALLAVSYVRLARAEDGMEDFFLDRAREELARLDEMDTPPMLEDLLAGVRAEVGATG